MKKLILLILLLPAVAWGASETQTAASWDTTYPGTTWETPADGLTDNNTCAGYSGSTQDKLILHNFGFSAVTGTVDSINVTINSAMVSGTPSNRCIRVQLTKTGGGDNTGVGDVDTLCADQASPQSCAGSIDSSLVGNVLWNTTWGASDITASTFGIMVWDYNTSAAWFYIDAVTTTVYYTAGGGGGGGGNLLKIRK